MNKEKRTIGDRLQEAIAKQKVEVDRFNALEAQKQEILKECLRLDGEIRLLTEMKEKDVKGS